MDNDISLDLDLIDNDDDLIKDINDLLPPAQDIQLPESSVEGIDDDDFDAEKYIKHQFESVIPEDTTLQKVERRVDIRNDLIRKAKYVNENRRRGEKYSYRGNTSAELGKFVEGNDLLNLSHDEVDELRYAVDGIYSQAVKDRWFGKVFWDAINRSGMKSGHMAVQSLYAIKKADEEEVENLKAMSQAYQEMELYDRPKYIQQVWDVRGVKDAFMWALEATGDNSIHMTATMGAFMIPVVGPYAGIATSMVLNTGEAIGDQIEEDRLHRGYALLQGAGYTAVELATGSEVRAAKALTGGGFRRVAWQATKEIRKEAAQKAAKETFSTTWKEFFKFLVKQGIGEGIEEVVQNNITRAVRAFQTGDYLGPDEHSAWDAAVNDAEEFLSAFVSTIGHSSFSHGHKTRQNIREVRSADEFLSRLGIEKARDAAKALNKYTSAVADITENIKGNADFYTLSPYDRAVLANTLISNAKRSSYASLLDDGPMPEDKSKRISKQLEYIDNIREAALQTMSEDAVELLKTYEEAFSVHGFEILRPQDEGTKPGIITIPVKNKSDFNVQALHESKRQEVNADGTPTGNTIYRDPDSGIAIIESKEGDYTVYNDQGYQMPSERNEFLASEGDALQKALRFAKQLSMFNNKMLEINGQKMQLVRAIANKAYPGVNVAGFEGPVSLPDDVRERFIKQSRGKAMYGFFDDETNTVYVDVRHIRSPIDAAITLFHESLHEGFRNWWSTLNQKEKENYTDGMTDEQFKVFEESLVSGHEASMIMPGSFEDVLGTMVRKFARKVLGANWALSQGEVNLLINRILPHRTTSGEGSFEAHRIVRSEDDSVNWRNVEEKADVDERADTNEAPAPDADVDTDEAPAPKAEPAAEPEADVDADEAPAPEVDAPETKGETDIKIPLEPEGEDGDTAPAAEADESPAPAAETDAKPVKPDEKSESPAQKEREDVTLEDALLVRSSPGDKHYDTINSAEGRPEGSSETFTVITPDGEMEVSGQFDVVDANDFLTGKDAGYYGPFQGRERSSVESQKQILSIANDPRAIQLDGSPVSDSGSPIVLFKNGSDHVVSGNGRTSGLRLAYQVGNAEKYRAHVEQRAKAMGIDTSGMKAPILVRRANDMSLRDGEIFAEKSNADQKLAFTASELAVRDAKVLEDNPQVIRMYNPSDSGNMHAASNHEFLVNFVDKTGDTSLRHQSGKFTDAIEKRVWHALIFRMLGKNTPENRAIITRLAEEAAEYGVVRQVAGLGMAAQTLLDIAANKPDFDLTPALARALEKLLDYKGAIKTGRIKPGTSFAEFSRQLFFDGFDNVSHAEKTAAVLAEILAEAKSVKQIKEFFENYKRITDAVIKKGEGLFAELEVTDTDQTTADALQQARERANGVEEQDIFSFSDGGATEGQKPSDPSTDRSDDSNRQPKQQKPEDPKPKQKPKPVEKPKEKPAKKKAEQPKAEEKPAEKKAKQSTDKDAERKKPPTQAVLDKYAEEFGGGITLRVDGDNVVVEGSTFQNRKELGGRGFFWNPAYKWWQKSVFSFNLDLENQAKREQEKADAQKKFLLDIDMLEENPAGWSLLVPQHLAIAIRKGDKRDIARSIDAGAWIADHGEFTPEQQGAVIDAIMRDEKVSQDIRDFISDEVHGGGKVDEAAAKKLADSVERLAPGIDIPITLRRNRTTENASTVEAAGRLLVGKAYIHEEDALDKWDSRDDKKAYTPLRINQDLDVENLGRFNTKAEAQAAFDANPMAQTPLAAIHEVWGNNDVEIEEAGGEIRISGKDAKVIKSQLESSLGMEYNKSGKYWSVKTVDARAKIRDGALERYKDTRTSLQKASVEVAPSETSVDEATAALMEAAGLDVGDAVEATTEQAEQPTAAPVETEQAKPEQAAEEAPIVAAYDALFDTIETKQDPDTGGTIMFRMEQSQIDNIMRAGMVLANNFFAKGGRSFGDFQKSIQEKFGNKFDAYIPTWYEEAASLQQAEKKVKKDEVTSTAEIRQEIGAGVGEEESRTSARERTDERGRVLPDAGRSRPTDVRGPNEDGRGKRPPLRVAQAQLIPDVPQVVRGDTYSKANGIVLGNDQVLAVNLAIDAFERGRPAFLLADGAGVGKTMVMLATADQFRKRSKTESRPRILIIGQNRQSIQTRFTEDAKALGVSTSGFRFETYSGLAKMVKEGAVNWDLVVFDEAHNLKNADSQRSMAAARLQSPHKLFATATPIDKPTGAAYFMAELTGKTEQEVALALGYRVEEQRDEKTGRIVSRPVLLENVSWHKVWANIKMLRNAAIADGTMVRREFPFYGKADLSEKTTLTEAQRSTDNLIDGYFESLIEDTGGSPTARRNYSGQRTLTWGRANEYRKVPQAVELAEKALREGKQVIIVAETDKMQSFPVQVEEHTDVQEFFSEDMKRSWTRWYRPGAISHAEALLVGRGITDISHIHDTKNNVVADEMRKFQSGENRVVLMTPQSGGTSIDLDDKSGGKPRMMIILSKNFAGDQFEQVLYRVSRRNTASPAEVVFLENDGTSDSIRNDILDKKLGTLRAIQGDTDIDDAVGLNTGDAEVGTIRFRTADQVAHEFTETERRIGGRQAYDTAKQANKTALNYRQWVQVRTPAFKAWFGDWEGDPDSASKVVNPKTGEPLVVYHNTNAEFWEFDAERQSGRDEAFYFSSSRRFAGQYGGNVMEVFVNLRNPLDYITSKESDLNDGFWVERGTEWDEIGVYAPNQIKSATANDGSFSDQTGDIRFRAVTDHETLSRLNKAETFKAYRAMQVINGELYPAMSAKADGEFRQPSQIGVWEEAVEQPGAVKQGKFALDKAQKGASKMPVAYNPYIHASNSPLNDQFASAYKRDNLVVVEVEIPTSELTSGYRAEGAKDAVGAVPWRSGPVASKLSGDNARQVYLTRWAKPVRIVPDSEVARMVKDMLDGTDIAVPSGVVHPSLLSELKKAGVLTQESDIRFRAVSPEQDAEYMRAVDAGDMDTAERMVLEAARAAGYSVQVYHGSDNAGFWVFRTAESDGVFATDSQDVARGYSAARDAELADWRDSYMSPVRSHPKYFKRGARPGTYSLMAKLGKSLRVDADGTSWSNLPASNGLTRRSIYSYELTKDNANGFMPLLRIKEVYNNKQAAPTIIEEYARTMGSPISLEEEAEKSRGDAMWQLSVTPLGDWDAAYSNDDDSFIISASIPFSTIDEYNNFARQHISPYAVLLGRDLVEYEDKRYSPEDIKRARENRIFVKPHEWRDFTPSIKLLNNINTRKVADFARNNGYDSAVIENVIDNGPNMHDGGSLVPHTVYWFRDSSSLKMANLATYDDAGNVIPLSERFNEASNDIRFRAVSPEQDAEYMRAVDAGDMEKAQKMVDEAARQKGYISDPEHRMMHSAPDSKDGSPNLANLRESGMVPNDFWTHPHYYVSSQEESLAMSKLQSVLKRIDDHKRDGKSTDRVFVRVYRAVPKSIREGKIRNGDWVALTESYARNEGVEINGGYRIITQTVPVTSLWWDGNSPAEFGYDDGKEYAYKNTKNNRKDLAPVAYDDDGSIIPLSKRFDFRKYDIRFRAVEQQDFGPDFRPGRRHFSTKAHIADLLIRFGLEPYTVKDRITNQSTLDEALAIVKERPDEASVIMLNLRNSKRPATPVERTILLLEVPGITEGLEQASAAMNEATVGTREHDSATARFEAYANKAAELSEVMGMAGTAAGQALQAIKIGVFDDFSLAGMMAAASKANNYQPLTPDQVDFVKQFYDEYSKDKAEFERRMGKEKRVGQTLQDLKREARKRKLSPDNYMDRARTLLERKLDAQGGDITKGDLSSVLQMIARAIVTEDPSIQTDPFNVELHKRFFDLVGTIFPDLTQAETESLFSGYGQIQYPSSEEVDVRLRQLRELDRLRSQLRDVEEGDAPLRTGKQRDDSTHEARELQKKINALMKEMGIVSDDPKRQIKTPLDALKQRIRNRIEDLEHAIRNPHLGGLVDNSIPMELDDEAKSLKDRRDFLQKIYNDIFNKPDDDAKRLKTALKIAQRNLEHAKQRLERAKVGDFSREAKRESVTSAELESLRQQRDSINALIEQLQEEMAPEINAEKRLQRWRKSVHQRMAMYDERIENEDFAKKPVNVRTLSEEDYKLHRKLENKKREFTRKMEAWREENQPLPAKIVSRVRKTSELVKAIRASYDWSALGRQGLWSSLAHPVLAAKAINQMARATFSQINADRYFDEMQLDPDFQRAEQARLALVDPSADAAFMEKEESFTGRIQRFGGKAGDAFFAGIDASDRAYSTFLNFMRFEMFKSILRQHPTGNPTLQELKVIGHFVNVATARGDITSNPQFAKGLSAILWAPRLQMSRIQMMLGEPIARAALHKESWATKAISKEYGRMMLGTGIIGLIAWLFASLFNDDDDPRPSIGLDPRSTQFGKVRYGDQFLDLTGGAGQMVVLGTKIITGERKTKYGQVVDLRGPNKGYKESTWSEITSALRGKLLPIIGLSFDLVEGESMVGEPTRNLPYVARSLLVPLGIDQMIETAVEDGWAPGMLVGAAELLGFSASNYQTEIFRFVERDYMSASKAWRDAKTQQERDAVLLRAPFLKNKGQLDAIRSRINKIKRTMKRYEEGGLDTTPLENQLAQAQAQFHQIMVEANK